MRMWEHAIAVHYLTVKWEQEQMSNIDLKKVINHQAARSV
jgi:hypothetical protein